ncbi:hypothetical protein BC826DRAFT_1130883 [Russula brevipes]|nr:hypothetical protein BC826DRAFT_1130883 [Russula brevipes]
MSGLLGGDASAQVVQATATSLRLLHRRAMHRHTDLSRPRHPCSPESDNSVCASDHLLQFYSPDYGFYKHPTRVIDSLYSTCCAFEPQPWPQILRRVIPFTGLRSCGYPLLPSFQTVGAESRDTALPEALVIFRGEILPVRLREDRGGLRLFPTSVGVPVTPGHSRRGAGVLADLHGSVLAPGGYAVTTGETSRDWAVNVHDRTQILPRCTFFFPSYFLKGLNCHEGMCLYQ